MPLPVATRCVCVEFIINEFFLQVPTRFPKWPSLFYPTSFSHQSQKRKKKPRVFFFLVFFFRGKLIVHVTCKHGQFFFMKMNAWCMFNMSCVDKFWSCSMWWVGLGFFPETKLMQGLTPNRMFKLILMSCDWISEILINLKKNNPTKPRPRSMGCNYYNDGTFYIISICPHGLQIKELTTHS